jgi:hypothetical protein
MASIKCGIDFNLLLISHPLHHHPCHLILNGLGFGKALFQGVAQDKQCIDFGDDAVPPIFNSTSQE